MSMRLQEVHPSLVHFPIALLPTALAADAIGRVTGNTALMDMGRRTMPLAAASAVVAGVFGLVAQEAVKTDEHTRPILTTHRNLNLGLIGLTLIMARQRMRRRRPSIGYLLAGAVGGLAMTYSAYLGGHMVYEHGVGVSKAGGLLEELAPRLTPSEAGEATRVTGEHIRSGVEHTAEDFAEGELVPYLTQQSTGAPGRGTQPT